MRTVAFVVGAVLALPVVAQAPLKPGPEHKLLKRLEGTWETTVKAGGKEYKGAVTYRMELSGLWLVGSLESALGGQKYHGKSLDTYDAKKKKFVSYFFDDMGTTPLTMEGSFDKEKKRMTMVGEGPGMDGKLARWRSVSEMPDNDTVHFHMYVGGGKEPTFTVTYKRKK
jgi:hypothetical protein